jgi:hypothetical protein
MEYRERHLRHVSIREPCRRSNELSLLPARRICVPISSLGESWPRFSLPPSPCVNLETLEQYFAPYPREITNSLGSYVVTVYILDEAARRQRALKSQPMQVVRSWSWLPLQMVRGPSYNPQYCPYRSSAARNNRGSHTHARLVLYTSATSLLSIPWIQFSAGRSLRYVVDYHCTCPQTSVLKSIPIIPVSYLTSFKSLSE